uniref:PH domain-containing protein n=1 Tax=Meloidogyne hapla TaxID=6305 RepID=A0A1I8B8U6_MELHA
MHSSPRFSKNNYQHNECNSMLSTSSGGSSTLMDHVSQKQRRQKGYISVNQSNRQQNFRKFTSAVSKPGQARETREAISRVLSAANANPFRPPPISEPIDYEKFITEKSAQLENDRDRDMLLFFRDDVSGSEIYPRERTAVPSIKTRHIEEANWLLAKDALKFYCSPYTVITFNYLKFAGDFKKFIAPTLNGYLRFESDIILDEEKLQFAEQNMSNEVLKEGNLVVLPGDSIVDSFKSEKKRYCILRRLDDCKVYIEVYKQNTTQQLFPALEIKSAQIKGTKRGKTLQVCSVESDKRTLLFSAENESDLQFWLFEIDRAIATKQNKEIVASEDSASLNSSLRENSVSASCPNAGNSSHDSESLASEDSVGVRDSISLWRGKNAAAKALRPPIVERNNLFALYWDMEPLPEPANGEKSTLIEPLDEIELNNSKSVRQIAPLMSAQKLQPKKSLSMLSADDTGSTSTLNATTVAVVNRESSPDPSHFELFGEKSELLFTAQIEPFFIRLFLFDASQGSRISEEFHIEIPTQRYIELRNSNSMVVISSKQHSGRIHGISRQKIQSADKLICPIQNPRPDLYLVAIVERILSDIPADIYTKLNSSIDAKTSVKIQKSISASFLRLSHLKSTFAWTATPIFPSLTNGGSYSVQNSCIRNCPIYKCDGRLTDIDLQKLLIDMQKPERTGKWAYLPNAGLTLMADITSISSQIPMRISSTYHPLRPWRATTPEGNDVTPPLSPSFELQSFVEQSVEPHRGFTNLLYVYPISLNYSAQKTFTRARNIVCNIKWICNRHVDKNSSSRSFSSISSPQSSPIFNRIEPNGPLVKSYNCAVQYHEQWPYFNDEIKIQLPTALESTDHLLFTFSHVSVANALSGKQNNEQIETPIGYSWLPFTSENNHGLLQLMMSSNMEEFELPVAANLPKNYFNFDLTGGNKEGTIPQFFHSEMHKFVDGGKNLFKVRLRLFSTIFTTEERIQNFFQLCQCNFSSFERLGSIMDLSSNNSNNNDSPILKNRYNENNVCSASDLHESLSSSLEQNLNGEQELANVVEILASVDIVRITPFVEVIFNRLFSLLTISKTQELALASLGTIFKLVNSLYVGRKSGKAILRNYIRLHFNTTLGNQTGDCETLHGSICKLIPALFNKYDCGNDIAALDIQCLLRQLWFLFDCCTKSMAHWLILSNLIRAPRTYRFPNDQYFWLEELFTSLMEQIVEKHNKFPEECRSANLAMAVFLKYCLSLMDRHQIMKELHNIVRTMDSVGSRNFRIYKFELLHILTGHEHWIPLCLPLLTDKYGNVMRGDSIIFDGLSPQNQPTKSNGAGGFFSKLFSHIFSPPYASHESNEIDRYSSTYSEHFYCSETYCSVHFMLGLLFQELTSSLKESREYRRKIIRLLRNLLAKHCQDQRYGDTSARNRIAILYLPLLRFVTEHVRELEATSKGLNKNESPMLSPVTRPKVNSSDFSSLSSAGAETLKQRLNTANSTPSNKSHPSSNSNLCRGSNFTTSSLHTNSPSQAASSKTSQVDKPPNSVVVLLAEKLDKSEVRDLILTSLYVLSNIPKRILAAFWNAQETTLFTTKIQQQQVSTADKNNNSNDEPITARQQPQNLLLDFIRFLELALLTFRYRGRSYHLVQQEKRMKHKNDTPHSVHNNYDTCYSLADGGFAKTATTNDFSESFGAQSTADDGNGTTSFQMDCNLAQEVALVVLECIQIIANQVSLKTKYNTTKYYDAIFVRLLNLELELLSENWPETIRLQTLAALAVFVNLFSSRFFHSGPLDCLSTLVKTLLLQLNSRISRIQTSAAALLQLILKGGFDASTAFSAKLSCSNLNLQKNHSNYSMLLTEKLGRPGAQISVALARLLSEKQLDNFRFEKGLLKIESLVAGGNDKQQTNNSSSLVITSLFERAVLELVKQLRGVLEATRAITDMIQMADLHVQLADSYRGSAALRSEFFDALSNIHITEGWYSEAAVCQAHSLAIVGKELQAKNLIASTDWSLLNILNEQIAIEEELFISGTVGNTQLGGFTIEDFTRKVDDLVRTLLLSERYEAIGPIYRLSIPIFEKQLDFKYLVGIYAELQQACSRAAEIKLNAKRHLGSYFKVVFHGQAHFWYFNLIFNWKCINLSDEHKTEWIYREPKLTSLAETCDRMVESVRLALGHDRVQVLNDKSIDESNLDPSIAFIQVAYVEPSISPQNNSNNKNTSKSSSNVDSSSTSQSYSENNLTNEEKIDSMAYNLHTNVWTFIQEEKLIDDNVDENEQEMARTALRRLILTVESPFPNTRRRQRIVRTEEHILSPLELACECLIFKAGQIRKILAAADIPRSHYGIHDKETLKRLDLKQLQLFLQGSVSPTVNAGLLAYAESFTSPAQKQRYGKNGIGRLVVAFKTLIAELDVALRVNEAALAGDRLEYQSMLRQSFDGMLERLSMFFEGEKFLQKPGESDSDDTLSLGVFGRIERTDSSAAEMHIFDSISGLNG